MLLKTLFCALNDTFIKKQSCEIRKYYIIGHQTFLDIYYMTGQDDCPGRMEGSTTGFINLYHIVLLIIQTHLYARTLWFLNLMGVLICDSICGYA